MVDEILSPRERMAEPGGPIKMIFFEEAASDSGNLGFSEAWPLDPISQWSRWYGLANLPTCPYRMYIHSLCNIHNQLDVGVIVVVGAPGYLECRVNSSIRLLCFII